MSSSVVYIKLSSQFFLYSTVQKSIKRNKLKLSTLNYKCKSYQICRNIDFTIHLTVHRGIIKTTAAMGCEWLALINGGWITK